MKLNSVPKFMNEMCEWGAKSSCPVDSLSLVDIGSGSVADRKS